MLNQSFGCNFLQYFRHEWQTWNWTVISQCVSIHCSFFISSGVTAAFLSSRGTVSDLKEVLIRWVNIWIWAGRVLFSSGVGKGSKHDDFGLARWIMVCTSHVVAAHMSVMGCSTILCVGVSMSLIFVSETYILFLIFITFSSNKIQKLVA